ncbi:signal peptide peptidase SppA (plasmid) [Deinococcus psychrotolerans]|uniref:Signal peptide peptidase SppA n=1 Tax=Deinococcus psychrotolerans TaxID=2489213 RepID=A0A3G8YK50_9DEIO|nr:signal peptide peptidase SppA [Deinococcus psychrotolerans]AZI45323.1 signal peptide peptidase SppA [Deinococcus psychrotolerans]
MIQISKLEAISSALYGTPWAITEAGLNLMTGIIEAHIAGVRLSDEEKQIRAASQGYGSGAEAPQPQVALMNLHGVILSRASADMTMSGYTDPQRFAANMRRAADDPNVSRIVLSIDSPGGSVSGTRAAGDAVAYAASKKEVIAVADDMAASAAYWIGAQATRFIADPGATVGSIGVIMALRDTSEKNAKDGVQTHVLRSGPEKALGQPGEAITDATKAHYAEQLATFHDQFVQAVAAGRGMPLSQAQTLATGRTWIGQAAVEVGLADEVGTVQQALAGAFSAQPDTQRLAAQSPTRLSAAVEKSGGAPVPPEVLAMLGLSADATTEQIQAAIDIQRKTAASTERTNMLAALGLSEEPGKPANLSALAAQAKDGALYREAQLDRLHALTITNEGNDEAGVQAADDAREVYAGQSLERISGQITRLEARRDTLPGGQQSKAPANAAAKSTQKLNLSAFGLGGKR